MPQHRILCKYHLHGACLKGDSCQFSHNFEDPSSNVCTFYQRGVCSYGNRCRYDHVKLRPKVPDVSSSAPAEVSVNMSNLPLQEPVQEDPVAGSSVSRSTPPTLPPLLNAWQERPSMLPPTPVVTFDRFQPPVPPPPPLVPDTLADLPLCSAYAASGYCVYGDACPHIHGQVCSSCNKAVLHPYRPDEIEEHKVQCRRTQQQARLLVMSQNVECGVCLERVLSKASASERKFGILSGCDHPFCISCIRGWRAGPHPGMDIDSVVRACPICRTSSHYVVPSVHWYSTPEEKEDIVNRYKSRLSGIDCKHFNFGNGRCPFGTSCFYKHAYSDGTKEEVKLRHLGTADGTVIAKDIRLSDFLFNLEK